MIELLIYCK